MKNGLIEFFYSIKEILSTLLSEYKLTKKIIKTQEDINLERRAEAIIKENNYKNKYLNKTLRLNLF